MKWVLKEFDKLTVDELYALLQLRSEVFVVEQNCVFQDLDNKDKYSHHLMGWQNDKLIAASRLVPPGVSYKEPSIGRVVTSLENRNKGIGKLLMEKSIEIAEQLFGRQTIKIGAQLYLINFYSSLGFKPASPIYIEDGIEHLEMIL
ncbi:MAG: GNAT family N-acetyltransferase [Chitinophagaceae bacterium]